jgi:hypothetical protein
MKSTRDYDELPGGLVALNLQSTVPTDGRQVRHALADQGAFLKSSAFMTGMNSTAASAP